MQKMIDFYDANGPFGEFSNYFVLSKPIIYKGKQYASSEHLYQSLKFQYDGASDKTLAYAETIRNAKTPNMAKILARQQIGGGYAWRIALNKEIQQSKADGVTENPKWDEIKIDQMEMVLQLKFEQNAKCRDMLLSTGDATLAEHTHRDRYWGDGGNARNGENILGKLLVKTRAKIQQEKKQKRKDNEEKEPGDDKEPRDDKRAKNF